MKPISELRTTLPFYPQEINSSISFFAERCIIDYDVYLPSKKRFLQRNFVWNIDQKREIILSILMNRNIPRMAMINTVNDIYEVIDGKQRLSSMIGFYYNEYTLLFDKKEYYFKELPEDYQRVISGYMFPYYIVNEDYDKKITDQQKIDWFRYINFAGTPQDKLHLDSLK